MAAILCESFGKVFQGTCDALGTVLCLPFRACGIATEQITKLCTSPFCMFVTVAAGLNLPPIIFAGKSLVAGEGCASASNWMPVNALLCLINMVAAVYMSAKIAYMPESANAVVPYVQENAAPYVQATVFDNASTAKEQPEKTTVRKIFEDSRANDTRSGSYDRVKEILCYDPVVAIYIIIGIFYVVWQTMGVTRAMECEGDMDGNLSYSIICGFLFISIGGMTFLCSLCCLGL